MIASIPSTVTLPSTLFKLCDVDSEQIDAATEQEPVANTGCEIKSLAQITVEETERLGCRASAVTDDATTVGTLVGSLIAFGGRRLT